MTFKPMLAGKAPADLHELRYPVLASPKLDGIRCLMIDGVPHSRNLKPIPNKYVREALVGVPDGVDGELMVEGGFNACQSAFMSVGDGTPFDFWFFAFDWHDPDQIDPMWYDIVAFNERLSELVWWSENYGHNNLHVVEHVEITNAEDLATYEREQLAQGFEGVMVRCPHGAYKHGRSTTKEGGLLKIKQFVDEEAQVVGVVERMHNANDLSTDELGHAKRSSAKAGLVPAGDLGALVCRTPDGAEFQIGSGFTASQREALWNNAQNPTAAHPSPVGRTVTFKHQPDPGGRQPGQAPRFPVFLGFRSDL